jgi:hypothetical protein
VDERRKSITSCTNFVADVGLGEKSTLSATTAADSLPVFENDEWMKRLEGRIVGLERNCTVHRDLNYMVPVDYLLL